MKVIVEGEPTDEFGRPLDDETVGEFLDRINQDLSDTNRVVAEAKVDGELLDETLRNRDCEDVDSLELELSTMEELTIDTIGQVGSYCHRYLDRIPDIIDEWESYGRDQVEQYRHQVLESLNAAYQLLTSVDTLTNLDFEESNRGAMAERAQQLRNKLSEADPGEVKTLLEDSIRSYYEDLLETLQGILSTLQERRDFLVSELEDVREDINEVYDEVQNIVSQAQERSEDVNEWLNLEKISDLSEKLTGVSQFFQSLDQSGKLKTMVPSERQESFEDTLMELRDDVSKMFKLLEDRDPTQVVKTLKTEVEPHVERAREFLESLDVQQEETEEAETR